MAQSRLQAAVAAAGAKEAISDIQGVVNIIQDVVGKLSSRPSI
jgi:hypothetical protein